MDALEDSWRINATVGTLGQPVTRHVARTIRCGSHQPSALEGLARLGTGGDLMRDVDRGVGFGVGRFPLHALTSMTMLWATASAG